MAVKLWFFLLFLIIISNGLQHSQKKTWAMKSSAWFAWCGVALLVLCGAIAFGQTNLSPAVNGCIVPVPRTDERGTNRYVQLCQRVQDCQGQADILFLGDSITQAWEVEGKAVWAKYYAPRHALNLGIGIDRTQHVFWRLDHGHHFLDFGYLFIQPDGKISKAMMSNSVHLTPTGYRLWPEAMEPKLAELLSDQPGAVRSGLG